MKKIRFPVILFPFIVGVLVFFFLSPNINKENEQSVIITNEKIKKSPRASLEEGTPAPEFELSTLNGEKIKLADQTGKTVILNFWATWCPPCKEEMPHLKNFYVNNDREKIEIIAINLTDRDNGVTAIKSFAEEYELPFPIALDEKGEISALYQAFGIPTNYIIDPEGNIAKKILGPVDEDLLNQYITEH